MKKYSVIFGLVLVLFLVSTTVVSADGASSANVWEEFAKSLNLPSTSGDPSSLIADWAGSIINWAVAIAGVGLTFYLIFGGYLYLTAGGDPARVEKAQAAIKNALIGFAIVAFAFTVSAIVQFLFGVNIETDPSPGTGGPGTVPNPTSDNPTLPQQDPGP